MWQDLLFKENYLEKKHNHKMGLILRKPDLIACKNKGADPPADWPAHLCSLVNTFVFHSMKIIIHRKIYYLSLLHT